MYQFPIGVILESFRTDRSEAIRRAAEMGAQGIQMYATNGANAPESLTPAATTDSSSREWAWTLRYTAQAAAERSWCPVKRSSIISDRF